MQNSRTFFLPLFNSFAWCAIIVCTIAILPQCALAQVSVFSFLRNEPSARIAGLGGAGIALEGDISASMMNPAVLATSLDYNFEATFFKHISDINSGTLAFASPLERYGLRTRGTAGIAVNYINYGSFDRTTNGRDITGNFSAFDMAVSFMYANQLDTNWFYGVSGTFIASRLDDISSTGFSLSAGMLYRMSKQRINLAVALVHAGSQLSAYTNERFGLPADLRVGFNHTLRGLPLLFNFSFNSVNRQDGDFITRFRDFSVGGEIILSKNVQARVGYNNNRRQALAPERSGGLSGMTAGIGVVLKSVRMDYGFSSFGAAGMAHRITLNANL
jgi:hypothetical protein